MLLERTNRDVAAFHEALADITAIFLHFTLPGVVEDTIGATQARLTDATPLAELAQQFGHATGRGRALRSALDTPDPTRYEAETEAHARGAILVAAVFDAFTTIYQRRIADLLRLATGGSGVLPQGSLHPDLVSRVAREAVRTADQVLTMCLRAFDYLPTVDVTFSDFLRAVVTADRALFPTDEASLRTAFIDAFRRRGIYPEGVMSLGQASLAWPGADREIEPLPVSLRADILALDTLSLDPWAVRSDDLPESAAKGARNGSKGPTRPPEPPRIELAARLEAFLEAHADAVDLSRSQPIRVREFGTMFRYDEDGAPHVSFTVQCVQRITPDVAPGIERHLLESVIRRSSTIVFDESGYIRHVVSKPLPADDLPEGARARAQKRFAEMHDWLEELGSRDAGAPFGLATGAANRLRVDFALLHAGAG
jgi:hypothetical protein